MRMVGREPGCPSFDTGLAGPAQDEDRCTPSHLVLSRPRSGRVEGLGRGAPIELAPARLAEGEPGCPSFDTGLAGPAQDEDRCTPSHLVLSRPRSGRVEGLGRGAPIELAPARPAEGEPGGPSFDTGLAGPAQDEDRCTPSHLVLSRPRSGRVEGLGRGAPIELAPARPAEGEPGGPSFDTGLAGPAQDEDRCGPCHLVLSRPRSGRVEGRGRRALL